MSLEFLLGLITVLISVLSGLGTFLYRKRVEDVTRMRQMCAEALGALLEWLEVPYRIRRRRAGNGEARHDLASMMHGLQVKINFYSAWLQVEAPAVAEAYEALHQAVKVAVGSAIQEAWKHPGVTKDPEMNTGTLGDFGVQAQEQKYVKAVRKEMAVFRAPWRN